MYPSPEFAHYVAVQILCHGAGRDGESQGHGGTSRVTQSVAGLGCAEHRMVQGLHYEAWKCQCKLHRNYSAAFTKTEIFSLVYFRASALSISSSCYIHKDSLGSNLG